MSRETTEARGLARYWDDQWRPHKTHCSTCALAAQKRHWPGLCDRGAAIRTDMRDAGRDLARNRELDKQPAPDQEVLF